ncbi:MAG: hypothetical protein HF312_13385 [Ignavibacteria bacterium]|jgi:hypothetical protein|nr:hypothetical protein [Ignavibacteria bacterium]MCU7521207.1 hypothetical protein [Ignavibacteria bacterium]
MELKKLNKNGQKFVDEEFLSGDSDKVLPNDSDLYEDFGRKVDLTELKKAVDFCINKYPKYDPGIDAYLAPIIHKELNLTPGEAADKEIWFFLSVAQFPELVRHRWKPFESTITRDRFLGEIRKNTFYRLWLGAQLTQKDGNYNLTSKLFKAGQQFVDDCMERRCSQTYDSINSLVENLSAKNRKIYRSVIKKYMQRLSLTVLEYLDKDKSEKMLSEIESKL